jgi:hypothetical protein
MLFGEHQKIFCIQKLFKVIQRFDETIGKLRKTVFFNGNPIASKTYKREDVFTGPLQVWISDKWHMQAGKYTVVNFLYETYNTV